MSTKVALAPRPQQLSINDLPHDVLRMIVSLIPRHPRVRAISTLSRRLRAAVLSSITNFDLTWSKNALALDLLRDVSSMRIFAYRDIRQWPATLRSLDLSTVSFAEMWTQPCHHSFTKISCLTSLIAPCTLSCSCFVSLCANNAPTLTELSVPLWTTPLEKEDVQLALAEVTSLFSYVQMPSLRSFSMRGDAMTFPDLFEAFRTFLSRHSTQLTHVSLYLPHWLMLDLGQAVAFPNVTSAAVELASALPEADGFPARLLPHMPALTSLSLHAKHLAKQTFRFCATSLTHLRIGANSNTRLPRKLRELKSLTLDIAPNSHPRLRWWPRLATQLRTLTFSNDGIAVSLVNQCTALTDLSMPVNALTVFESLRLPNLTRLHVTKLITAGYDSLEPLKVLIAGHSKLRELIISSPNLSFREKSIPLLIKAAEQHGLTHFSLATTNFRENKSLFVCTACDPALILD